MNDSQLTGSVVGAIPTLDVRDDLRNGREPFSKIMATAAQLQRGEKFLVIAPFEPAPLFRVLADRGFGRSARRTADGNWEVLFTLGDAQSAPAGETKATSEPVDGCGCGCAPCPAAETVDVDARGLEPPQPLVKILEALAVLPGGAECLARTDRRPMHLYAQLAERGFTGRTEEQEDGSFITRIRRD
jgi:uncharacterized protein (DUF2249 family)